ncbi:MAG: MFS transporter [Asticcacaulis sp.]
MFEWFDFYIFGTLTAIIGAHFFEVKGINPTTATIFAWLAFAAAFIVRPLGAFIFGRIGDRVGRKTTFLVTMILMGLSTFAIGFVPDYQAIGLAAPAILVGPAHRAGPGAGAANTAARQLMSPSTPRPAGAAS